MWIRTDKVKKIKDDFKVADISLAAFGHKEIRIAGRNTQGVRIIKLTGDEKVVSSIKLEDKVAIFCLSRIVPVKSLVVFGPIKGTIKKGPSETFNLARVDPKSLFLITVLPLSRS